MNNIAENVSLKGYNTFGIDQKTTFFTKIKSVKEVEELVETTTFKEEKRLILGGGSNILLLNDFKGLVIKNEIKGIEIVKETNEFIYVKAGGGEIWQEFVLFCVEKNWAGIENLSLIPGSVGASPMQNIGAYGVEIKDVFHELEAFSYEDKRIHHFNKEKCKFGYRESIFKNTHKGRFLITSVTFKLNKNPILNTSYGAIEEELKRMNVAQLSIQSISNAVINIRKSKLPDPSKIGNSGSFFKNPIVENKIYEILKEQYPTIPGYKNGEKYTKIAAGWLIEQAGWKGKTIKNCGVHKNQALVLVNYGKSSGQEIYDLSQLIIDSIKKKFEIQLEREVNIVK